MAASDINDNLKSGKVDTSIADSLSVAKMDLAHAVGVPAINIVKRQLHHSMSWKDKLCHNTNSKCLK